MGEMASRSLEDDGLNQFSEWREGVEAIISFTPAKGLEGALVQLALALNVLDDVLQELKQQKLKEYKAKGLQIDRLIRSALRAVRTALPTPIGRTVESIADMYTSSNEGALLTDRVRNWSEKGRVSRERESH